VIYVQKIKRNKLISRKRALEAMRKRSKKSIQGDISKKANKVFKKPNTTWLRNMGRSDIQGIDTPKSKNVLIKNQTFQMKNKKYNTAQVIKTVKNNLKKKDSKKLNDDVNREYKKREKQALDANPNWNMYYPTKKKYLESRKITREDIKHEKQGEIIQEEFNKTIHRRVKAERAITDGSDLNNISDETLMKNLDVIRRVRKHEVGRKYKEKEKY